MSVLNNGLKSSWDKVVWDKGHPFQSFSMLKLFEDNWKGDFVPYHIYYEDSENKSLIPLYFYKNCPRLDYYKNKAGGFRHNIIMSHALVGWYGTPVYSSFKALKKSLSQAYELARDKNSALFFAGIDVRNIDLVNFLKKEGFKLCEFHSITVRNLQNIDGDPTKYLSKKRRGRVRSCINKAILSGVTLDSYKKIYRSKVTELIHNILIEDGVDSDVLPKEFIFSLLDNGPKGLDVLVAVSPLGEPIGVHINFYWNNKYYIWLAGHNRSLLKEYQQSHFLFEESIKRALMLNCKEIHAGRDPYEPKIQHGFEKIPLLAAIKAEDPIINDQAAKWLMGLEQRHNELYKL
ncbi:GNAT family N-acetyltransferase [Bacillus fonticola]|uniref:GNAT family N-acetyltransferase n=1 Tax=Bacillus fonticola TaxID=2728853 RepID=UPI0014752777|nr:GNAT family N-acetyltransferase [Bacillus fonticola]